jgi:hypothetical protein
MGKNRTDAIASDLGAFPSPRRLRLGPQLAFRPAAGLTWTSPVGRACGDAVGAGWLVRQAIVSEGQEAGRALMHEYAAFGQPDFQAHGRSRLAIVRHSLARVLLPAASGPEGARRLAAMPLRQVGLLVRWLFCPPIEIANISHSMKS